ncbi:MAG: histidinol-phosphatase [Pleomorphochaeta sp.]
MNYSKYNLHTHSFYCGHGKGELSEYVREAKSNNIELLGFSEHCPVKENRWRRSRMAYETLETYIEDVNNIKKIENEIINDNGETKKQVDIDNLFSLGQKREAKQNKSIKILSGFECDYFPSYHNYLEDLLEKCDYLIFGVHYLELPIDRDFPIHHHTLNNKALNAYTNQYIKSIESGLFSFAAHPDLFFLQYFKWDNQAKAISKEIIEAAIYYDIPLEVNGNGIIKNKVKGFYNDMRAPYPVKEFWQLASTYDKLKIVTNADAHSPYNLEKSYKLCNDFAKELNIDYKKANIENIDKNKKIDFV